MYGDITKAHLNYHNTSKKKNYRLGEAPNRNVDSLRTRLSISQYPYVEYSLL